MNQCPYRFFSYWFNPPKQMPTQEDNREKSEEITRTGSANHGFGEQDLQEQIALEEEEDEEEDESNSLLDD